MRADFSEIVDLVARLWLWVRIGARFLGGCVVRMVVVVKEKVMRKKIDSDLWVLWGRSC